MTKPGPVIIVRYGEISLKKKNRGEFERILKRSISFALKSFEHGPIARPHGRILIREPGRPYDVADRVTRQFGVTSVSPAVSVATDLDAIQTAAIDQVAERLRRRGLTRASGLTMKVESRRVDKGFPINSMDLSRQVADAVLQANPEFQVRMKNPDVTVGIEVRHDEALVFAERLAGPGGLPIGSLGEAVALLSGGIDSPVAAWLAMKRGLRLTLLHFHAAPFVGDASREKAVDLARELSRWAGRLRLCVLAFEEIQVMIRKEAPEPYRTLIYRRVMNRLANRLARELDAGALVTGESLGQVASQTVENLTCIEDAAEPIVLRPLLTYDKQEIIRLAERIATYDISCRPHPDCCTLFTPTRPKIRGDREEAREIEERLDLGDVIDRCWRSREMLTLQEGELLDIPVQSGTTAEQDGPR